ncbi:MAG: hypothetical protein R2719_05075 [Micropruina sp.]
MTHDRVQQDHGVVLERHRLEDHDRLVDIFDHDGRFGGKSRPR